MKILDKKYHSIENVIAKKKNIFYRIFKIGYWIAITLICLFLMISTLLIILSQSKSFRETASSFIVQIANKELVGKIYFKDLWINPLQGVTIEDVTVMAVNDTVFSAKKVVVDIKLISLLKNNIDIRRVDIQSPVIKILRSTKDSTWNVTHIAKPSTDTTKSNAKWLISVGLFNLYNGNIRLTDSTSMMKNPIGLDYMNFHLKNVNLALSAVADVLEPAFKADIKKFNFYEVNSNLKVNELAINAEINTKYIKLNNLNFVSDKSKFNLSASIDSINIFGGPPKNDISRAYFKININGKNISAKDVVKIGNVPISLGGDVALKADVEGRLNNLNVHNLKFKTDNSDLNLSCNIYNLLNSNNLQISGLMKDSHAYYGVLKEILPGFDLRTVPDFGFLKINQLNFHLYRDSVYSVIDVNSALGSVRGTAGVGFGKNTITYSGNFTTEKVNLKNILKNNELASSINGDFKLSGSGTKLSDLKLNLVLDSKYSSIANKYYDNTYLQCNVSQGIIKFDSLLIILPKNDTLDLSENNNQKNPFIFLKGNLNIVDLKHPKYSIDAKLSSINIEKLINNDKCPDMFSGNINYDGEGFELDSLTGALFLNVQECTFKDRSLMPFDIAAFIERTENNRSLYLSSNLIDLSLSGNYNFTNFISLLRNHGQYLAYYLEQRINSINPVKSQKEIDLEFSKFERINHFTPVSFRLHTDIKDISTVNLFLDKTIINLKATIDLKMKVDSSYSSISIDSLQLNAFQLDMKNLHIQLDPMSITGNLNMALKDSIPEIDNLSLNVNKSSNIIINNLVIKDPFIQLKYIGKLADFRFSSVIDNDFQVSTAGSIHFFNNINDISLTDFEVNYKQILKWKSTENIYVQLKDKNIDIISLYLKRDKGESISLSGKLLNNISFAENLNLKIENFNLSDAQYFSPSQNDVLKQLSGTAENIDIDINGDLKNPVMKVKSKTNNLTLFGTKFGELNIDLNYLNSITKGKISLSKIDSISKTEYLNIAIESLPYYLGIDTVSDRMYSKDSVNITAKANNVPLELASLFVKTGIKKMKGFVDLSLNVHGYEPNQIDYYGSVKIKKASFLVESTNLSYLAEGDVSIEKDKITINKFLVKNQNNDISSGYPGIALAKGVILLKDFNLNYIDITAETKGIKVLSKASAKVLPTVYGDFIISTGPKPLRFYGTLMEPYLHGSMNILYADLSMPQMQEQVLQISSNVDYRFVSNKTLVFDFNDTTNKNNLIKNYIFKPEDKNLTPKSSNYDISKLIDYDIDIKIPGAFNITMDLGLLQQLYAVIEAKDKNTPLRFTMSRNSQQLKLFGELAVTDRSKLSYFKILRTKGSISMPSGSIDNPTLDLTAECKWQTQVDKTLKNYSVLITITGTKNRPNLKMSYSIDNEEATGDSVKISEDALYLLASGKTKSEMSSKFSPDFSTSVSPVVSKYFSDLLQNTGVISNADIEFESGTLDLERAMVKLSGKIGWFNWRAGGTMADVTNRGELTIDIPLPFVLHPELLNNIVFQLTTSVRPADVTTVQQRTWEARIKFGGSK